MNINDEEQRKIDAFRERKPNIKRMEEGFDIEPIQHVISQVSQLLMSKATHEMRKQDKFNPTLLGGVSFYMDYNEITQEMRLHFDKNPKTWDQKSIIDDVNEMSIDIYMEKQAELEIQQNDNPFTY